MIVINRKLYDCKVLSFVCKQLQSLAVTCILNTSLSNKRGLLICNPYFYRNKLENVTTDVRSGVKGEERKITFEIDICHL